MAAASAAAVTSIVGYGASTTSSIGSLLLLQQQARQHHLQSSSAAYAAGVSVLSSTTEDVKGKDPLLSGGVIAVIVLGTLCLILGAIYGYIYFTRINPRSNRIRKYMEQANQADDGAQTTSTHLFLFKKS